MNPSIHSHLGSCLKIGHALSVAPLKSTEERVARVADISPDKIGLKLLRPLPALADAKQVRIKCCHEEASYLWRAGVIYLSAHEELQVSRSEETKTLERRRSIRLPAEIPLSIRIIQTEEGRILAQAPIDSKTRNLSPDGLAFECDLPLQEGDELKVSLQFSSSEQLSFDAWVVRSQPIQRKNEGTRLVGLEFLELRPETRRQILRFLARVPPDTQTRLISTDERKRLTEKRRLLAAELRFLQSMPRDSSALEKREKAIRAELDEIQRKLGAP